MTWTDPDTSRFEVWALSLGTQMGTHIDAPSHFVAGAATMDVFDPQHCFGRFRRVDAAQSVVDQTTGVWAGVTHLFLDARADHRLSVDDIEALLTLSPPIWVLAGQPSISHPDRLWFHQRLAEAGKFLIEDINTEGVDALPDQGEIVAAPLKLSGLSGSPIRVLMRGTK